MRAVTTVKCTHVMAQVNLGFYDAEGNLVGEETFPQVEGSVIAAKLFHPHAEQLTSLIAACVEQAWGKLEGEAEGAAPRRHGEHGDSDGSLGGEVEAGQVVPGS